MALKMKSSGLPAHLKAWGLSVEEAPGWTTRGRPYDFKPKAIIAHHTASNKNSGNKASQKIVTNGRADLSGPLCQILLARDGTVVLIAAGYANHAGYGGPKAGIPANQGNTYSLGIEAENNGVGEEWSKAQLNAYYRLCAALLNWMGTDDVSKVIGHKEWTSRKIDPAGINMDNFRKNVKKALKDGPGTKEVKLANLKPGKSNKDVYKMKQALAKKGYYPKAKLLVNPNHFGNATKKAYSEWQGHLNRKFGVNLSTEGTPGKYSLKKLGLKVV